MITKIKTIAIHTLIGATAGAFTAYSLYVLADQGYKSELEMAKDLSEPIGLIIMSGIATTFIKEIISPAILVAGTSFGIFSGLKSAYDDHIQISQKVAMKS